MLRCATVRQATCLRSAHLAEACTEARAVGSVCLMFSHCIANPSASSGGLHVAGSKHCADAQHSAWRPSCDRFADFACAQARAVARTYIQGDCTLPQYIADHLRKTNGELLITVALTRNCVPSHHYWVGVLWTGVHRRPSNGRQCSSHSRLRAASSTNSICSAKVRIPIPLTRKIVQNDRRWVSAHCKGVRGKHTPSAARVSCAISRYIADHLRKQRKAEHCGGFAP